MCKLFNYLSVIFRFYIFCNYLNKNIFVNNILEFSSVFNSNIGQQFDSLKPNIIFNFNLFIHYFYYDKKNLTLINF